VTVVLAMVVVMVVRVIAASALTGRVR